MSYKNDAIERRIKILEFLVKNKETTRLELAKEFHVCVNTIVNDLYSIEKFAPVYTKQGKGGEYTYCRSIKATGIILLISKKIFYITYPKELTKTKKRYS